MTEYIVGQPIEGAGYSHLGFHRAFRAVVDRRDADPAELRVAPQFFADYGADLVYFSAMLGRPVPVPAVWSTLQFNGVPVVADPEVPPMMLRAVYPIREV